MLRNYVKLKELQPDDENANIKNGPPQGRAEGQNIS
jgi:hypothetical protein